MSSHVHELKFRLMTIDLLKTAKRRYTYRELSELTGLPVTVLNRYVKGNVLPTMKRAKKIWKVLSRETDLKSELSRRIKFDEYGYFDNTDIITDLTLIRQITQYALTKFAGRKITKVLTAAVDGVPIATMIANALDVNLLIAKRTREVGIHEFIEETYIPSNSAITMSLYLPKRSLRRSDSVLIVDDIIRSGETQRALINIVQKSKAEICGIFILIAVGDSWKRKLELLDAPIEVILNVPSPS